MFDCLASGPAIYQPSKFWEMHNAQNIEELEKEGFGNFKRTLSRHYFTWLIHRKDPQYVFLSGQTPWLPWLKMLPSAVLSYDPTEAKSVNRRQQIIMQMLTRMLWRYTMLRDPEKLLARLAEPAEGNPPKVRQDGKLISQDVANSALEYYSVREHFQAANSEAVTICELGAGSGRDAFVFCNAFPHCKYIIIDIPPALYISQRYLTAVFPGKKVFQFRPFDDFEEVRAEFEQADLVFLLPHQADLLPPKIVDLFLNISSLHEMKLEQIAHYLGLIDRLTKGFFYSKQWQESINAQDDLKVRIEDYPIPAHWKTLYVRQAKVHVQFFEAMYQLGPA
jgi:putative sugar O-methyltransferase